ncbi:scarecrow-like protein 9 [Malania oleifera]|uniref:scarecrow-like protein 9 n=1 Tax=Malania oleifera TaxID=397392 RepID=UPI0025AE8805|nr:scarecrow-like protein 9 [Malania oleifera]
MVMDPHLRRFPGFTNGIQLGNQYLPVLADQGLVGGPRPRFQDASVDCTFRGIQFLPPPNPPPSCASTSTVPSVSPEEDSQEDCDFSDAVLGYINKILMEEDLDDKTCMLQESLELQAAEKSFYEVIGKRYPPSPDQNHFYVDQGGERPDDNFVGNYTSYVSSSFLVGPNFRGEGEFNPCQVQSLQFEGTNGSSNSSFSSLNSASGVVDGLLESPISTLQVPDLYSENQLALQFRKGVEEASKFLPNSEDLSVNLNVNGFVHQELKEWIEVTVKAEKKEWGECSPNGSKGRKNPHREDFGLEDERSSKQPAVCTDSPLRSEMFDLVLLCNGGKSLMDLRESLQNGTNKTVQQNIPSKLSKSGKGRGKKPRDKKEVVDLRTLLIHCAQAVAADDCKSANELLKQIKQHASPFGDGNQRLAHCFANGLEARIAGTGSQIHRAIVSKRTSAADILKAYHLYCAVCPFRKLSNLFSSRTIINAAVNYMRVHVIDFGIHYGFQWPTFFQRLSERPGGPPKVRITGIDFPRPGFRPAERIEETGRRLATYAESFNVQFEYHAIAKRWDIISLEELKIKRDELLVVNCLYRFQNLLDESVTAESPRNMVLNLIRKISPDIFIHGVLNGAFNAPFFVTRFREALFHFSALFDMLEANVPREDWERILIEREIFGKEALNVIACEGWERVERPETYKQSQLRNLRAGFVQRPLDREVMRRAEMRLRSIYHKDFSIDEDSQWMLQGWKGRIVYALSSWKPA